MEIFYLEQKQNCFAKKLSFSIKFQVQFMSGNLSIIFQFVFVLILRFQYAASMLVVVNQALTQHIERMVINLCFLGGI